MDYDMDRYFFEMYAREHGIEMPEWEVARVMMIYSPPFLLVIGTIGNLLSALILCKLMNKVLSTCMYIFVGMVTDLLVLYMRCGNEWLDELLGKNVAHIAKHSSKSVCKIYPFVSDWALHLSMWLSVAMAIETTMVTMRPQRLMRMCRQERGRAVILLIIVLLVCVNAHNFWTFSLVTEDDTKEVVCTNNLRQSNQLSTNFRLIVWPIIDILVTDLLPICICFSCSVMLITRRLRMAEHMRHMENTWKAYSIDSKTAKQLQLCFLAISFLHVVLLLPKLGCDIFFFLTEHELRLVTYSVPLESRKVLAKAVCSLCLYIFLSFKVVIFLIISRTFRRNFLTLLLCRRCCSRNSGATNRVSTQQPLLNTVSNSNHVPHQTEADVSRKIYSTTTV